MANNWNQKIVDEFRANEGKVGGYFAGKPLLLLHHKGAKSGQERVNPLAYQRLDDDTLAVFASSGGAPTHPDWYYNLVARPEAAVEIGTETIAVKARVATGPERAEIWERQKVSIPSFAEYERKTTRRIPVVVLERRHPVASAA